MYALDIKHLGIAAFQRLCDGFRKAGFSREFLENQVAAAKNLGDAFTIINILEGALLDHCIQHPGEALELTSTDFNTMRDEANQRFPDQRRSVLVAMGRPSDVDGFLVRVQEYVNAHPAQLETIKSLLLSTMGERWREQVEALRYSSATAKLNEKRLPMENLAEARRLFAQGFGDKEFVEGLIYRISLCPNATVLLQEVYIPLWRDRRKELNAMTQKDFAKAVSLCCLMPEGGTDYNLVKRFRKVRTGEVK